MSDRVPVSHFVHANGLRHHVLEFGGPAARTVVMLHGFLDHSRSFVDVARRVADAGFRVLLPDLRGHGRTDRVPLGGYYYFPDYIADLAGLLDALAPPTEVPRVSIVGHSMGGGVTNYFAGTFPDRVQALVIAEGTGPPAMTPDLAPLRMQKWLSGLAKIGDRAPRKVASVDDAFERLRVSHSAHVSDETLMRVAAEMLVPHPSGEGLTWHFDPLHQTTSPTLFDVAAFEAFVRNITSPVLLLDAGDSGYRPADWQARYDYYARGQHVVLEGAGHMMHWTQPDRFADAIVAFLSAHVA